MAIDFMLRSQLIRTIPLILLLTAMGCATPIGVKRVGPHDVHRMLTGNVLSTGGLSVGTTNVLYEHDLVDRFDDSPADAIDTLHAAALSDQGTGAQLAALAELAFFHAAEINDRRYYLAAAIYAYAYLFPGSDHPEPSRFDPRTRLAADVYNRGITEALTVEGESTINFHSETYDLHLGRVAIEVDPSGFQWGRRELIDFLPVAELAVRGLSTRHREPGIGAPLAAGAREREDGQDFADIVADRVKLPVTAVLRLEEPMEQLRSGDLAATLEIHPAFRDSQVTIDGQSVPLEVERTAALAYQLSEEAVWKRELRGFFGADNLSGVELPMIASLEPYRQGLIPVIFVHGTASSPGRWAQMTNDLLADARVRDRFYFVYFMYDTGNPIAYSAMLLRELVSARVELGDPEGTNPCVNDMVVIGHSQGGLLAKMTAIRTGDRLWQNVSNKPLSEFEMKPETRSLIERALFIEPLPFVRRVIFIATPHRGSFLAGGTISRLVSSFVTLPRNVAGVATDLLTGRSGDLALEHLENIPTSVDNMTPGSPFIKALASIPVVDGVATHSIIGVQGDGSVAEGNDGVVEYKSAHIANVLSELVVPSPHSMQAHPYTIAEVRRILMDHAAQSDCVAVPQ